MKETTDTSNMIARPDIMPPEPPNPMPMIGVFHPSDLGKGDYLVIGKRRWNYAGRGGTFNLSGEYKFEHHGEPGDIDKMRIYSQSELEAFSHAGFLRREVPAKIVFPGAKDGYKS